VSVDNKSQVIASEEWVEDIERRLSKRISNLELQNTLPSVNLQKYFGDSWECCSCGKTRFYTVVKPAREFELEQQPKSLCPECYARFERVPGA